MRLPTFLFLTFALLAGCLESNPQPSPGQTNDKETDGSARIDSAVPMADTFGPQETLLDDAMAPADSAPDLPDLPDTSPLDAGDLTADLADLASADTPGPEPVTITVDCFHAPYLVTAWEPVPVAFLTRLAPCVEFSGTEVTTEGNLLHLTLQGIPMETPCPPCITAMRGVAWLPPLEPGLYTIRFGDQLPTQTILASAGDYEAPSCIGSCPPGIPTQWVLGALEPAAQDPTISCDIQTTLNEPLSVTGECGSMTITTESATAALFPDFSFCGSQQLFFGGEPYDITATYCALPASDTFPEQHWIMGLALDSTWVNETAEDLFFLWRAL